MEGSILHGIPLLGELLQDMGLGMHVVEDQAIGDQVAILDPVALDPPIIRGNQPLAPDSATEPIVCINHGGDRRVELLLGDVMLIDPGDLPLVKGLERCGRLGRPQITAITERRRHIAGRVASRRASCPESGPKDRVQCGQFSVSVRCQGY